MQLLIPRVLQKEFLQNCHNSPLGGHLATVKTLSRIRPRFYWYRLAETVKSYISLSVSSLLQESPSSQEAQGWFDQL